MTDAPTLPDARIAALEDVLRASAAVELCREVARLKGIEIDIELFPDRSYSVHVTRTGEHEPEGAPTTLATDLARLALRALSE